LTYIYDDAEGISRCLTPSDLIYGYRSSNVPSERHFELTSTSKSLTRKARYEFRLLSEFIHQWRRDYLLSITEMATVKARHTQDKQVVSAGEIVILKDEHTPRCFWKLARVIKLLPGRDGHVQAAKIWVLSSDKKPVMLHRPIQFLIPLEVQQEAHN